VVETTMQIYQELLSLKFEEITEFDAWHESVRLFVVYDAVEGSVQNIACSTIFRPHFAM
jgi:Zn-dependent oligopeptidase